MSSDEGSARLHAVLGDLHRMLQKMQEMNFRYNVFKDPDSCSMPLPEDILEQVRRRIPAHPLDKKRD